MGAGALIGAAGGIVNTGLGLVLEKHNDRRQLRQQGKLQAQQIEGQKQMTDYNYGKQMQMWNETNYGAQMEKLKEAGLNPGLIYGMGGGGGQSTNVNTGNVSGGNAPTGGGEIQAMGMQLGLIQAQIENIKAQTEKTKAETGNVPLTGENIKADTIIKQIEGKYANESLEDRIRLITAELMKEENLVQITGVAALKDNATLEEQKQQIKLNVIKTEAETQLIKNQVVKTSEEAKKIATEISQMAQKLQNETNEVAIKQQLADFETKWGDVAGSILKQIFGGLITRIRPR